VVREVDALGGIMGRATDLSSIQFRMLNRSKGPAVWSPRAQCDRGLYRRAVRSLLERHSGLTFMQATVSEILIERGRVTGIRTHDGVLLKARAVVLTAGTFLRGQIHVGTTQRVAAGRAGEAPSIELAEAIVSYGISVRRFKTGTPPRIDGRSARLLDLERQDGDPAPYCFSYHGRGTRLEQRPCFLTHTGPETKAIIEESLGASALYGGAISGRGPRYCPSIEDKVVKFSNAERHQVFLEPEGLETTEMYVNGLSTSLPAEIQLRMLRSVRGLEMVEMTRPGYAIEYDYFPPDQLTRSLGVRQVDGLYFAGQVNGTTGYEEAAGQGIVAGINAAADALGVEPVVLRRDEAMIGVLVDDLVTRGVDEPYRLFTSRAEYRLLLRQDNALRRLLPVSERLGLLDHAELTAARRRLEREDDVRRIAESTSLSPAAALEVRGIGSGSLAGPTRLSVLARRPGVGLVDLLRTAGWVGEAEDMVWAEIELKYEGYLQRERDHADRLAEKEDFELSADLPYAEFRSVSMEAREKLARIRPSNLGQAARIPGVSPSDLQNLLLEACRWYQSQHSVSRETDSGSGW
jgi:tRNA uridine 5-carboxymethylaminomethyl modification enzyme